MISGGHLQRPSAEHYNDLGELYSNRATNSFLPLMNDLADKDNYGNTFANKEHKASG